MFRVPYGPLRKTAYGAFNSCGLLARDVVFWQRCLYRRIFSSRNTAPIVLCNAYPKSGTHLLFQILGAVPGYHPWKHIVSAQSLSGVMNTAAHVRWKLGSAPAGTVVRSHLTHCPEIMEALAQRPHKRFFICRDLRDVVLSHAKWVNEEKSYFLHPVYRHHLRNDAERLMASIVGTPAGSPFGSNASQPSIGLDFAKWCGWLDDPETLVVRFEDLVGDRGGGDDAVRETAIRRILEHLSVELSDEILEEKLSPAALDPSRSHTFRKGMIGGWREAFEPEHKEAFKAVAGNLLVELGYEKNDKW